MTKADEAWLVVRYKINEQLRFERNLHNQNIEFYIPRIFTNTPKGGNHKSESAKMLENRGSFRFVENKMKPKTCKLYFGARKPLFLQGLFFDYYWVGVAKLPETFIC